MKKTLKITTLIAVLVEKDGRALIVRPILMIVLLIHVKMDHAKMALINLLVAVILAGKVNCAIPISTIVLITPATMEYVLMRLEATHVNVTQAGKVTTVLK